MGESDGHVRRWRDYWTCEDRAVARREHAPKRRSLGGNIAEGNPKGAQACALAPPGGGGSVANVGVLPVSNWGLRLGIGSAGTFSRDGCGWGGRVNGHESYGLCLLLVVVAQIAHLWAICGRHELGLDA